MGAAIGNHARSEICETIKRAMESRKNVRATYDGFEREFSPHTLGTKGREERVLGHQFAGQSVIGLGPDGSAENWRCFFIEALLACEVIDGRWHSAPPHSQPQTRIDDVDVEVVAG